MNRVHTYIKWLLLALLALTIGAVHQGWITFPFKPTMYTASHDASKKDRWAAMEKEVESWTDALGLGIDPGIKKMVIVLNLLGFKTEQSCEGHSDWGRPYPWVRITVKTPKLEDLFHKIQKTISLIDKHETAIQEKYPELSMGEALRKGETQEVLDLYKKRHMYTDTLQKKSKLSILPLRHLLMKFYEGHAIDPDSMLVLTPFGFESFELVSLGGEWQAARTTQEKLSKLKVYQQEMNSLADFLTEYFFKK